MEKIFVTFQQIGQAQYGDKIPFFHMGLNYQRVINGQVLVTRIDGAPSRPIGPEELARDFAFWVANPKTLNNKPDLHLSVNIRDNPLNTPAVSNDTKTVLTGNDLSSTWAKILQGADKAVDELYYYNSMSHNSNSLVNTLLDFAGLPPVRSSGDLGTTFRTPGSMTGLSFPTRPGATGFGFGGFSGQRAELEPDFLVSCFLAGTPILLPDGSEAPIETIRPGDVVAAFAGGGNFDGARGLTAALEPRPVARLFANVTTEIIAITYDEAEARDVIPDFTAGESPEPIFPSRPQAQSVPDGRQNGFRAPLRGPGMTAQGEETARGRSRVSPTFARDDAAHPGAPALSSERTIYLTPGHTMLTASGRFMTACAALMAGEAFVSA